MNYIGLSCGYHDAALAVVDDGGEILFASHSERYSGAKHDSELCLAIVDDALEHCTDDYELHYYERPLIKYFRQLRSGESTKLSRVFAKNIIGRDIMSRFDNRQIHCHNHHRSHAAAGFQTSTFSRATVVVIDAIGEWDTATIWGATYDSHGNAQYQLLWRQTYPDSIGLFYSAMTRRVGLRPLDEEYILMGMAGWSNTTGRITSADDLSDYAVNSYRNTTFKHNFHTGVDDSLLYNYSDFEIAAATQTVAERLISQVMIRAKNFNWSDNLVYMGGVALNCLANRDLGNYFENIWIMPCPGDAGSSLGAAALGYGKRLQWNNAYLGHNIGDSYPVDGALRELLTNRICGIASGRAEFGPRALGNRSLLADPRGSEIKNLVNDIKQRQRFRPFAPVILEEHVHDYFEMPRGFETSPYMQTVARCKYPDQFPAIIHIDGTSRVQTVSSDSDSGIRQLLESWYSATGCPMLLNTSLNVRGEPMVNTVADAERFEKIYKIPVFM
jgi:carbamoyltransferase